jgi:hypothetical protein
MAALNFPNSPSVSQIHTENNKSWMWDGTSWLSVTAVTPGGSMTGYTGSIGDNSNTTFTITHDLNSDNIMTAVKEQSSGYFVYPDVKYVASNQVVVEFENAPTTDQYQIYVIGFDV